MLRNFSLHTTTYPHTAKQMCHRFNIGMVTDNLDTFPVVQNLHERKSGVQKYIGVYGF